MLLAACSTSGSANPSHSARSSPAPIKADLVEEARQEGTLTTIGLPRTWCGYGANLDAYARDYGITLNELDPAAISTEQLEVVRSASPDGPQSPDTLDLGLAHGPTLRTDGLAEPYRVSTWATIPEAAKDPNGEWWGTYYGLIVFEVLADELKTVPRDWDDLLAPEYAGKVALAGDPGDSGQAVAAIMSAGLSDGGSLDAPTSGLTYFRRLADAGNLSDRVASSRTIAAGRNPIVLRWSYLALADMASAKKGDPKISIVVPASGRVAVPFISAIPKDAPHPSAARLWQERLLSDEGQAAIAAGGCHPIRFDDLVARDALPPEALDLLPDTRGAVFPTADQMAAATAAIQTGWEPTVGLPIR